MWVERISAISYETRIALCPDSSHTTGVARPQAISPVALLVQWHWLPNAMSLLYAALDTCGMVLTTNGMKGVWIGTADQCIRLAYLSLD